MQEGESGSQRETQDSCARHRSSDTSSLLLNPLLCIPASAFETSVLMFSKIGNNRIKEEGNIKITHF